MSIAFIHEFQHQIYNTLLSDRIINSLVNRIYFGVTQDKKCPFLSINIQNIERATTNINQLYSVKFQVLAYAKDHHHKLLISLADKVITLLDHIVILCEDFQLLGIQHNNISVEQAKDLVINKLSINYQVLISRVKNA